MLVEEETSRNKPEKRFVVLEKISQQLIVKVNLLKEKVRSQLYPHLTKIYLSAPRTTQRESQ